MHYNISKLLEIGKIVQGKIKLKDYNFVSTLKSLGIFRYRGTRGGRRSRVKSIINSNKGVNLKIYAQFQNPLKSLTLRKIELLRKILVNCAVII